MGKSLVGAIQVLFRHYSGFFQKDLGDFLLKQIMHWYVRKQFE